ncbi:putative B3 domain-containing protein At2g27410 isoform X2 [Corylus avellana]|uniref:putative B3 domain-containing protein At2g27410 isoform X2 n=1 Tax=Corylus avellana TaxID=13451 RepID=UPI00286CFE65|nr:putative B3 domain-containing protein At2g27410 isoform X2 [Corylus avellana]
MGINQQAAAPSCFHDQEFFLWGFKNSRPCFSSTLRNFRVGRNAWRAVEAMTGVLHTVSRVFPRTRRMRLLNPNDFKNEDVDPTKAAFDMLLEVAKVAARIYDQEQKGLKRSRGESSFQKKKKSKKEEKPKTRSKKSKPDMPTLPNPPPDLPEEFKNRIEAMGGRQVVLVIQKALYDTDLKKNNSRLSIPLRQIKGDFLGDDERESLAQQNELNVPFIEPSHKVNNMILRQWDMPKESGKTCSTYVLRTNWNEVSQENGLRPKDVVQVWSFRVDNEQKLCLALVVVSRRGGNEGGSSSHGRDGEGVGV